MTPVVLIVEDDPEQCIIMRRYLRDVQPRPTVLEAHTGAEAVKVLRSEAVHMVITDQQLPGGTTGMRVAAFARARDIPAHVVSTDPMRLLTARARDAAVDKRHIPHRLQSWVDVAIARATAEPAPPPAVRGRPTRTAGRLGALLAIIGPTV